MHDNSSIIELISLLEQKHEKLKEILKITKNQTQVIKENDINKLESLIRGKQLRISEINRLDRTFINSFDKIKHQHKIERIDELDLKIQDKLKLKGLTKKVQDLMKDIYSIDEINKKLVNKNYLETKTKIKNLKNGKKVTSGYYNKNIQSNGYFIDSKK